MFVPRSWLLDCRSPVEWSHPLNRGLVAEWAIAPLTGWNKSNVLRDLVRGGKAFNDGTLTGTTIPTWQIGHIKNGGWGSLFYAAGSARNSWVSFPTAITPVTNTSVTLAAWINHTQTNFRPVFTWTQNGGGAALDLSIH